MPFVFGVGGFEGAGVETIDRAIDLRVAVDFVEATDRTDAVDTVLFGIGLALGSSTGLPPLMDGVVREATDGGRFTKRGVLAPVV